MELFEKTVTSTYNHGNSAPGTPRRDAFGLHLASSSGVATATSPHRRRANSTNNRLHVQSILSSRYFLLQQRLLEGREGKL